MRRKIEPSFAAFSGGARDEADSFRSSEEEILQIVRDELRRDRPCALNAEPLFARVYKWKSAMAQYSVGHLERVQRIESRRQNLPGLALAGNGYNGIGVPDCVRSGAEAAGKILAEMGMWSLLPSTRLAGLTLSARNQLANRLKLPA